jgi:hypothetical protein
MKDNKYQTFGTIPKYHTFGTVSKFNRKIVEKAKIDTLSELRHVTRDGQTDEWDYEITSCLINY